jgi:ABC-type molybdate transport system substrate-binding protein
MKHILISATVAVMLAGPATAWADQVTLIAPGGMRCPLDRMAPDFERKTGHAVKVTIGSGGTTHQQVVRGEAFDVPIVQPPTRRHRFRQRRRQRTPLATVPLVVVKRRQASGHLDWPTP